jgi:hypothetical protein
MKPILILLLAALLAGCSQKPDVISDQAISWDNDLYDGGKLVIHIYSEKTFETNFIVTTLDSAVDLANRYGWKFVSSEHDQGVEVYHLQRIAKESGSVWLIPQLKKPGQ